MIWSIAGTDCGGGAGLAADQRAAQALGVHLCPVVSAVTAQHSRAVLGVHPLPAEQLEQQLQALRADMRPRVIKTGLLGSVGAIELLARTVDELRAESPEQPLYLVVDPVLGASTGGAAFADDAVLQAYRRQLLPRADLLTPNRREAQRLLGTPGTAPALDVPQLARRLQHSFCPQATVCLTGGDDPEANPGCGRLALDWMQAPAGARPHQGWIALPRLPSLHHHGSGCCFASAAAAALARGFALPDALILAKMLSWAAVRDGHAAGLGAGPVRPTSAFIDDPACMPVMGFEDELRLTPIQTQRWLDMLAATGPGADFGLYAIAERGEPLQQLAAQGLRHVQLRVKADEADDNAVRQRIDDAVQRLKDFPHCQLWINDHWALAMEAGASALHLGQEDWERLLPDERERLRAPGLRLGLSSHSLWELARARGLAPDYIACGPIWPTATKQMPWLPQGLSHVAWWSRMAGRPVLAIGGLLEPEQVRAVATAGASGACLVRALDRRPLDVFQRAWDEGRRAVTGG